MYLSPNNHIFRTKGFIIENWFWVLQIKNPPNFGGQNLKYFFQLSF